MGFVTSVSLAVRRVCNRVVVTVQRSVMDSIGVTLIRVVPLIITALRAMNVSNNEVVNGERVERLRHRIILVVLRGGHLRSREQGTQYSLGILIRRNVLNLSTVRRSAHRRRLHLIILQRKGINASKSRTVIAARRRFIIRLKVVSVIQVLRQGRRSRAIISLIRRTTSVIYRRPSLTFRVTRKGRLHAGLPFLTFRLLTLRQRIRRVTLRTNVMSCPRVTITEFRRVVSNVVT